MENIINNVFTYGIGCSKLGKDKIHRNACPSNIPYLVQEIESLVERGVPKPRILVSDRAQILMPYHVLFDTYEEARLAGKSFGSTKSGIAPFYSDKYAKIGFQVSELFDQDICTINLFWILKKS